MARLVARVQERGQITLPKAVREKTGIKPGDEVVFTQLESGHFKGSVQSVMTIADMLDAYREEGELGDYEAEVRAAEAELAERYR